MRLVAAHQAGLPLHYQFFLENEDFPRPSMEETIRRYGILVTKPGERYQYSNLGYGLLEYVIEKVSGKSYAQYMRARAIALGNGVRYAYTGNVHDPEGDTTYCSQCGTLVIERDWYEITAWKLTNDGRCGVCDAACTGRFDGPPGNWGRKRLPIRLAEGVDSNQHWAGTG